METTLRIIGDALTIAALAIIFSTAWKAHQRVQPDARVPLRFDRQGEPAQRMAKVAGLWTFPALALALLFMPTATMMTFEMTGTDAVMLFAMRAMLAALLAVRHIVVLQRVLKVLGDEGQLQS